MAAEGSTASEPPERTAPGVADGLGASINEAERPIDAAPVEARGEQAGADERATAPDRPGQHPSPPTDPRRTAARRAFRATAVRRKVRRMERPSSPSKL